MLRAAANRPCVSDQGRANATSGPSGNTLSILEGDSIMNARQLLKTFVILLVLSPVWASAQIYRFAPLPDLVPADVSVAGDCRMIVTIANLGPGVVPNSGYVGSATGIQMYM